MHNLTELHFYVTLILNSKVDDSKEFCIFDNWFPEEINENFLSGINLI